MVRNSQDRVQDVIVLDSEYNTIIEGTDRFAISHGTLHTNRKTVTPVQVRESQGMRSNSLLFTNWYYKLAS